MDGSFRRSPAGLLLLTVSHAVFTCHFRQGASSGTAEIEFDTICLVRRTSESIGATGPPEAALKSAHGTQTGRPGEHPGNGVLEVGWRV